ncbi:MAG: hypothetical protein WBC85_09365 [Planktotalea sp.]|uniref:DUF1127 domain-containing protein n=1 Tax=Planktotalea sp. TaxID=2029877 RepID=UPI003C72C7E9
MSDSAHFKSLSEQGPFAGVFRWLSNLWHGFAGSADMMLEALKHGRMMSVLSNMSDAQLSQIGITRADIPAYAKTLLERDQGH